MTRKYQAPYVPTIGTIKEFAPENFEVFKDAINDAADQLGHKSFKDLTQKERRKIVLRATKLLAKKGLYYPPKMIVEAVERSHREWAERERRKNFRLGQVDRLTELMDEYVAKHEHTNPGSPLDEQMAALALLSRIFRIGDTLSNDPDFALIAHVSKSDKSAALTEVGDGLTDGDLLLGKLRQTYMRMKHGVDERRRYEQDFARLEKIDKKQAERKEVVMEGTRCSVDGCRKPARVDDLCKIHAREAGTLMHGKIGAGDLPADLWADPDGDGAPVAEPSA